MWRQWCSVLSIHSPEAWTVHLRNGCSRVVWEWHCGTSIGSKWMKVYGGGSQSEGRCNDHISMYCLFSFLWLRHVNTMTCHWRHTMLLDAATCFCYFWILFMASSLFLVHPPRTDLSRLSFSADSKHSGWQLRAASSLIYNNSNPGRLTLSLQWAPRWWGFTARPMNSILNNMFVWATVEKMW